MTGQHAQRRTRSPARVLSKVFNGILTLGLVAAVGMLVLMFLISIFLGVYHLSAPVLGGVVAFSFASGVTGAIVVGLSVVALALVIHRLHHAVLPRPTIDWEWRRSRKAQREHIAQRAEQSRWPHQNKAWLETAFVVHDDISTVAQLAGVTDKTIEEWADNHGLELPADGDDDN